VRTHDRLDENLRDWISRQHVFFVATAPSGHDGHVNLSPKGYDTFRILDDNTVMYLDLTGSGIETSAHLAQNGRITFMFCAFEGPPRVLRLYGRGETVRHGHEDFERLASAFPALPGVRSIIRADLDRIQTSCGYAVPFMAFERERERLVEWSDRKGPEGIEAYWRDENAESIDGHIGLAPTTFEAPGGTHPL